MLEIKDIYHPQLAYFYSLSLQISFIITTIATFPAIYIIITQSKKAKIFKYILINQLLWSYLFCGIYVAEGNVPTFPLPGAYFVGIFKSVIPEKMHIIIPIHLFVSVGHTQSYFLACLYRVSYASAFSKFQSWFEDPRKLEIMMVGLLGVFSVIIVGPFIFTKYDTILLREDLFNEYPLLQNLSNYEPSLIAAPLLKFSTNSTALTIALNTYSMYVPFTFIAGSIIYLIFLKQALSHKNFLSESTYKNCMIVVRAKTVQMASVLLFLFLPYLIQFIIFLCKLKNGSFIALIAHFAPSYHLFFEILALFYFIKPYREFWVRVFGKMKAGIFGDGSGRKQSVSEATKNHTTSTSNPSSAESKA